MTGVSCTTDHAAGNSQAELTACKNAERQLRHECGGHSLPGAGNQQQLGCAQVFFLCVCACYWVFVFASFGFFPPVGVLKTQIMQITPGTVHVGRGELEPTKPQGACEARQCICPTKHHHVPLAEAWPHLVLI